MCVWLNATHAYVGGGGWGGGGSLLFFLFSLFTFSSSPFPHCGKKPSIVFVTAGGSIVLELHECSALSLAAINGCNAGEETRSKN